MDKPIKKFVSSKSKFYLINSLLLILFFIIILSLRSLLNNEIFIIFTLPFSISFLTITYIIKLKIIYWVYLYHDRLEFRNCIGRLKVCKFSEIVDVYKITLTREGTSYFLTTKNENKIFKLGFPFKFDVNDTTTKIINSFWSDEIKNIS